MVVDHMVTKIHVIRLQTAHGAKARRYHLLATTLKTLESYLQQCFNVTARLQKVRVVDHMVTKIRVIRLQTAHGAKVRRYHLLATVLMTRGSYLQQCSNVTR